MCYLQSTTIYPKYYSKTQFFQRLSTKKSFPNAIFLKHCSKYSLHQSLSNTIFYILQVLSSKYHLLYTLHLSFQNYCYSNTIFLLLSSRNHFIYCILQYSLNTAFQIIYSKYNLLIIVFKILCIF